MSNGSRNDITVTLLFLANAVFVDICGKSLCRNTTMIKTSAKQWLEIIGFADLVKGSYKIPYLTQKFCLQRK